VAQPKATEFDCAAIIQHLERHHPHCPEAVKLKVVEVLSRRTWETPITLGKAIGVIMTAHVRHQFTAYDDVIRIRGITKLEALAFVSTEVNRIIEGWRSNRV